MERLDFNRLPLALKTRRTGAAAHMSLHLPTMRKNRKTSRPKDRSSGDRLVDREVGSNSVNRAASVGGGASMDEPPAGQQQNYKNNMARFEPDFSGTWRR